MTLRVVLFGVFGVLAAAAQQPDAKALASISGRTVAIGGQPLRKAAVSVRPLGAGLSTPTAAQGYSTTSDADGNFTIEAIEPGRYRLYVEKAGYLRQMYGSKRASGVGTILMLMPGRQVNDLVVELTPEGIVTGKVVDEDGDPVARSNVMVMNYLYANGKRRLLPRGGRMTDNNGEFKVAGLAPGRYYLSATPVFASGTAPSPKSDKPEQEYVTTWYPGVADARSAAPVDVGAGQTLSGVDIPLRKSVVVRVRGRVLAGSSDSVPDRLNIQLMPRDGFELGSTSPAAVIAKDGSFVLPHVAPGAYNITATGMEGTMRVYARQPVDVGNQNVDEVALTLQPPFEIRGTAKTEGEPKQPIAPGAAPIRVMLSPLDGAVMSTPNAMVNADGTFVLTNVTPGKYAVSAFAPDSGGYLKAVRYGTQDVLSTGIDLTQGAGGTLEVIFSPKGAVIEGTVQSDGQPVQTGTVTLVPDNPQDRIRYSQTSVDQTGQFIFRDIAPGDYHVYAWEDLQPGDQYDPELLKPLESEAARVTVGENSQQRVSLNRISVAAMDGSRRTSGR